MGADLQALVLLLNAVNLADRSGFFSCAPTAIMCTVELC